jgi:hypothetical protein
MIVMVVAAGNVEGMISDTMLDFDNIALANMPLSFQPKWYHKGISKTLAPEKGRYIYFTVNSTIGTTTLVPLNLHDRAQIVKKISPHESETNIYFPSNGRQPTTAEAIKWSCANIDNRENSPITEWYMQMFGVVAYDGMENFITAGYKGEEQVASKIIDASFNSIDMSFFFVEKFKDIAKNPIGRVLLYRILIEIRRRDSNGNGVCEDTIKLEVFKQLNCTLR